MRRLRIFDGHVGWMGRVMLALIITVITGDQVMRKVLDRLDEPSTWMSIGVVISLLFGYGTEVLSEAWAAKMAGAFGALGMVTRDGVSIFRGKRDNG